MTIEETINSINLSGYQVKNLFELGDGTWQANLHDGEKVWEFGKASTPKGALLVALDEAKNSRGTSYSKSKKHIPSTVLDDLF